MDVRFIWLAGGLKPDHNTIARFRKDNWKLLESLFRDSVRVCAEAGLVLLGVVAVDGTKIESRASKRRVYSQSKVERQLAAVEKILAEAEAVDQAEDEIYGEGSTGQLPDHLRDAKERKARLEEIARRLREGKKKAVVETDADSRVMMTSDGLRPCYNLQAAVDSENQVIVAMKVTEQEDDHGELPGMAEEVQRNTGLSSDILVADCGYADEETLLWMEGSGQDVLMPVQEHPRDKDPNDLFASRCFIIDEEQDVLLCPAGRELTYRGESETGSGRYRRYAANGCQSCSFYARCVPGGKGSRRVSISVAAKQRRAMLDRLRSPDGKKLYDMRQKVVEPVFGQKKTNQGFDRFLLRGLEGARVESALMFLAHNVMKCAIKAANWAQLSVLRITALVGSSSAGRAYRLLIPWSVAQPTYETA